jgi:putative FmdB family regulatory protein
LRRVDHGRVEDDLVGEQLVEAAREFAAHVPVPALDDVLDHGRTSRCLGAPLAGAGRRDRTARARGPTVGSGTWTDRGFMAHHWQSSGESASPAAVQPLDQGATTVPTYQYACTNPEVKHEFEVVQSFTDAPVSVCPECDAPVRKVYGSVGVVFKGSGFYRTDSRKSATASETASSSSSSSGSKESSSAKPAATAAPSASGSGAKAAN